MYNRDVSSIMHNNCNKIALNFCPYYERVYMILKTKEVINGFRGNQSDEPLWIIVAFSQQIETKLLWFALKHNFLFNNSYKQTQYGIS